MKAQHIFNLLIVATMFCIAGVSAHQNWEPNITGGSVLILVGVAAMVNSILMERKVFRITTFVIGAAITLFGIHQLTPVFENTASVGLELAIAKESVDDRQIAFAGTNFQFHEFTKDKDRFVLMIILGIIILLCIFDLYVRRGPNN